MQKLKELLGKYSDAVDIFDISLKELDTSLLDDEKEKKELFVIQKLLLFYDRIDEDKVDIKLAKSVEMAEEDYVIIKDDDIKIMLNMDLSNLPLILSVRVRAFLFENNFGQYRLYLNNLASDFLELYKKAITLNDWYNAMIFGLRALAVSRKFGKECKQHADIVKYIKESLANVPTLVDNCSLKLRLIDKLIMFDDYDTPFKAILIDILENAKHENNGFLFESVIKTLSKLSKNDSSLSKEWIEDEHISFYIDEARAQNNPVQKVCLYNQALKITREDGRDDKSILTELDMASKNIESCLEGEYVVEFATLIDSECTGVEDALRNIIKALDSFSYVRVFNDVSSNKCSSKVFSSAGIQKLDSEGRTVAINRDDVLARHFVMQHFAFETSRISSLICSYLGNLKTNVKFSEEEMTAYFNNNLIIEKDRVKLFAHALYLALNEEFLIATYLLATQVEYIFRRIIELKGGTGYTYGNDGVIESRLLVSLLEDEYLIQELGPELISILKLLLNDKAGPNIRNKAAHGLLKQGVDDSESIFFCFLMFEIIFRYNE